MPLHAPSEPPGGSPPSRTREQRGELLERGWRSHDRDDADAAGRGAAADDVLQQLRHGAACAALRAQALPWCNRAVAACITGMKVAKLTKNVGPG